MTPISPSNPAQPKASTTSPAKAAARAPVTAPGTEVRLDPVRLLRGDFSDRMTAGKVAIDSGIYTVDEIRALELEAPREGE